MEENKPQVRFKGFTEDWKNEDVGKYYDFKNGLNKGKEYFGYGTPIVNFTDVFHNRGLYINNLKGKVDVNNDELKNYSVKKGDLFFTRTSETIEEIGFPSVMLDDSENTVFSGFVLRARPLSNDPLVNDFKKYAFFIESFRSEMVKKSSITTRALTSGTAIKKMLFTFPENKEEQQIIGTFFENIDKLISEHQQKHSKLKTLKKAMLSKMFPQQGQTVPEIRFKGFKGDWCPIEFKHIAELKRGLTYSPLNITNRSGIKVLRSSNINEDQFIQKNDDVFVKEDAVNIDFVKENDILITSANGSSRLVGKHALINNLNCKAVHGGFMLLARAKYPYFLNASMDSEWYSKFVNQFTAGGGGSIGNLSKSDLEEQIVFVPSEDEQEIVGNYFKNIDNLISNHQIQIEKLQNIKKAFLAKMFI